MFSIIVKRGYKFQSILNQPGDKSRFYHCINGSYNLIVSWKVFLRGFESKIYVN